MNWKKAGRQFVAVFIFIGSLVYIACNRLARPGSAFSLSAEVPRDSFDVIHRWPHDATAFTEGLIFERGSLWESTGRHHSSSLRQVDLETGKVLRKIDVPAEYYAEGVTIFQGKVFQLTYQEHKAFVYDPRSLQLLGELSYDGEGWGLTHDDQSLIMSDGTNHIRFLDPVSLKTQRTIDVFDGGRPVNQLNELEYIKGEIYANIWQTDLIIRIDPNSGKILGALDVEKLFPRDERRGDLDAWPNGIAYDQGGDRLFVSGKRWPNLFEIRIVKR
jgi:glutamine cyclotransferase